MLALSAQSRRRLNIESLSQSVNDMKVKTKLACAVGMGAAMQLAMAFELASVTRRDNTHAHRIGRNRPAAIRHP